MNSKIQATVNNLLEVLKEESSDEYIKCNVFFNCEGYKVDSQYRTPEQLKSMGISMRNLKGDFIK